MDTNQLPSWLEAFGTVGAVVVALFQNSVRNWWNRPKIRLTYLHKSPFIEVIDDNTESSDTDKRILIRIMVANEGNYAASYSVVNIDSYLQKRNGEDTYVQKEVTPLQLKDYKGGMPSVIAPHLKYYMDVATILKQDESVDAEGNGKKSNFINCFYLGPKNPLSWGKERLLSP